MPSKIFLDSGNPQETKEAIKILGYLDGQTTNPSLVAKTIGDKKLSEKELLNYYKKIINEISALIPRGSVSVEVYADKNTAAEEMLKQAREMFSWIPNAHIKFPITAEGLKAAKQAVKENIRVNMTLCFSQEQAAAVYAATLGAKKGDVFVSPFVGRLDDRGERGMDLIKNILKMYRGGDGHAEVLTASVRGLEHLLEAVKLKSDIITCPLKIISSFAVNRGRQLSGNSLLKMIPYQKINLNQSWRSFNIGHELTDIGLERFASDWKAVLK